MRRWALLTALVLTALAGALLAAGAGAQQRSLSLEERTPSSLTVTWSWNEPPPAAFELAWRARGDDESTAWRTVRKEAADRRHLIENLDAGLHYVVRLRGLDAADRPIHDLRGIFATSWSAPRLLRLLASRDGALIVGWSQPSDWNPRGWRLSWRVAGSQTAGGTIDLPAAARSRRIDGLSRATDYLIRLSALNARGGESPAQTIRATASAATLETPRLTALSWSGLTIRAAWQAVPRADGYDLFWRAAEERGGAVGRLALTGTSAEFDLPAAGAYWVELRARVGEGRAARRSDRTPPRNITLLPAPHYLRVQSFDGEQVSLAWPGADVPAYDLEWGRGGTKQTETRDGRSGLIEVGPLEGGNTYEFRVRARNDLGRSGWSPSAALSPTIWPQLRPLAALDTDGSLYALWPPAAGAEWYEAQWLNAADPVETARVRVGSTPTEGGGIAARIGRDGGFEDGRWLVRVRAGPWGTWSIPHALDLAGQPPRLSLKVFTAGSDFCVETGLVEIVWYVSGGVPPHTVTVDGQQVDWNGRTPIRCHPPATTLPPCDPLRNSHRTVRVTATDSQGIKAHAELQIAFGEPPPRQTPGAVLQGAPASAALRLIWTAATAVPSVCAYELQYQSTAWDALDWPDSWTAISSTIAAGATEYLHNNLDPARRYRYQLQAKNNLGEGGWSPAFPEAGVRPGAPVLAARTAASGSVALSWSAGPASALRWEYRRRQEGGGWDAWTAITGTDAPTAEYTVTGLTEDARYHFQLRARTASGAGPASATAIAVAGLSPTARSDRQSLHYDDLDSAGGAVRAGSYAFLKDADDLTSGATTFAEASGAEALLLNARGYARSYYGAALAAVRVGERFTWRPYSRCWYHYRVTEILSVPAASSRKLFRIALLSEDPCGVAAARSGDAGSYFDESRDNYATFSWGDPPNAPLVGPDGIRIMPGRYPAEGGHTYRLLEGGPIVIDVPAGMRLSFGSAALTSNGTISATYVDEVTGGLLLLDPVTGLDVAYYVETPAGETEPPADVVARFKALIASIREVPLP